MGSGSPELPTGYALIAGPEALEISLRLHCLCDTDADLEWMQIASATAGSGSFANTASVSRFECPRCHRQVAVQLIVQSRYERPLM